MKKEVGLSWKKVVLALGILFTFSGILYGARTTYIPDITTKKITSATAIINTATISTVDISAGTAVFSTCTADVGVFSTINISDLDIDSITVGTATIGTNTVTTETVNTLNVIDVPSSVYSSIKDIYYPDTDLADQAANVYGSAYYANAVIGAAGGDGTIEFAADEVYDFATNTTFQTGSVIKCNPGAILTPANGVTLTIYHINAGRYQIFDTSAGGTISFGYNTKVYPEWWGDNTTPGTTDMTAELLAASQACSSGGILSFNTGDTYIYDGSTPIPIYSNMIIEGNKATLKQMAGAYTDLAMIGNESTVTYDAGQSYLTNILIKDLIIDGNAANVTAADRHHGICAMQVYDMTVRDCEIKNLDGVTSNDGYGIIYGYSSRVAVERTRVYNTERQNICIWETLDATISNCNLSTSRYREPILISSNSPATLQGSHCVVSGCILYNVKTADNADVVRFSGQGEGKIVNCWIESSTQGCNGVYIVDVYEKTIIIDNCEFDDLNNAIEVASASTKYITITNSWFGDQDMALNFQTSGQLIFTGNYVYNSDETPIDVYNLEKANITGNVFDTGTYVDLTNIDHLVFSNNQVCNMSGASYPIRVISTGGADVTEFKLNIFESNTNNEPSLAGIFTDKYSGSGTETYDFSVDGGLAAGSDYILGYIPDNARIIKAWYEVLTTFTSATDAATLGIGIVTNDVAGVFAAVAISDATDWDAASPVQCIQDGAIGNISEKTTAKRAVVFHNTAAGAETTTAGKIRVWWEYLASE